MVSCEQVAWRAWVLVTGDRSLPATSAWQFSNSTDGAHVITGETPSFAQLTVDQLREAAAEMEAKR